MSKDKLGQFLREVSNWGWDEYVRAEKDRQYTSNQAIIFALIRACAMQKMDAIKISINRLDGKMKTPVRIEYPKIFYLYPNAKEIEGVQKTTLADAVNGTAASQAVVQASQERTLQLVEGDVIPAPDIEPPEEHDLPSMSFRETLQKMADYPRELPEQIVDLALQTEQWLRKQAPQPIDIPKVKSVVAAHLLILAQSRNIDALYEVFDQIDGKLVETIQVLGEDIYITSYSTTAPPGAYLNEKGVLQIEATQSQELWASKLGKES